MLQQPDPASDPTAQVVIRGRLVSADGRLVPNAPLILTVNDVVNARVGRTVPQIFSLQTKTRADGTFELRFHPTAELRAFGEKNSGFVNFDLVAIPRRDRELAVWGFSRRLVNGEWDAEIPSVTLHQGGSGTQP